MATLHVRNVPDELYTELRLAAEREGRSIGAQAVVLLRAALVEDGERRDELRRAVAANSPTFKGRFAAKAKDLVLRGQELARQGGSTEVLPAHVLLAMLEDDVLRRSLERGGVTEDSVRAALPGPARPLELPPPLSAEAREMLERALLATLG
jgi:plasmid stability protein